MNVIFQRRTPDFMLGDRSFGHITVLYVYEMKIDAGS